MYSQTCKKPTLKVKKWLSETKDNFHVNIFDIVTAINQKNVHESLRCYFSSVWRWMIIICGLQRTNIDIGKKMYPQPMLGWFFTDLRSKSQSTRDRCYFLLFFETSFLCNLRAVKKEKKAIHALFNMNFSMIYFCCFRTCCLRISYWLMMSQASCFERFFPCLPGSNYVNDS